MDRGQISANALSIVGVAPEKRRSAEAAEAEMLRLRQTPAVYIVDEFLNVLSYREDPRERRSEYRMPKDGRSLPPLVERTVVALLRRTLGAQGAGEALVGAPNASIVVRAIPLAGAAAYAIIVERARLRSHLLSLAKHFGLSTRECEVLHLVLKGAKNSEIARNLNIAESTAIFHVKRLLTKTNSRNRTELVSKAVG